MNQVKDFFISLVACCIGWYATLNAKLGHGNIWESFLFKNYTVLYDYKIG